jgi:SPP1 gp7 family putative phage head morphogenesis protein
MKRNEAGELGELVENPNGKWVIAQTTRDRIREIVSEAFTQDKPLSEVKDAIQQALENEAEGNGIFSPARAELIARTEVQRAQIGGNLAVWKKSGLIQRVRWAVSNVPPVCDECADLDGQEFDLDDNFEPPPIHANCRCVT